MDWKDIGRIIAPLAPTLGGVLGGLIPFPGGALAGTALGNIIARQFGVQPTPEAVAAAVQGSPNELAIAKLKAANEQAKNEIEGYARVEEAYAKALEVGLVQVGETMRVEILAENRHWFFTGWRPACGWVLVVHAFVFGCMLAIATFRAAFMDNPTPLQSLSDAWAVYLAYFGALGAVVGVAIFARSEDKKNGVDTSTVPAKPTPKPAAKK